MFRKNPGKQFTLKQIQKRSRIHISKREISEILEKLLKEGAIRKINSRYIFGNQENSNHDELFTGYVDQTQSGAAYITDTDLPDDIYVNVRSLNSALHGDLVKVKINGIIRGRKPKGEVIEVLERSTNQFIGTPFISRKKIYVIPDNPMVPFDILLKQIPAHVDPDHKIIVEILDWNYGKNLVLGEFVTTLEGTDYNDYAMQSILINHGFPLRFPKAANLEADRLKIDWETEINYRRDFRQELTFTIDPKTAKDFDDALSYKVLKNGFLEIGIHIADVTHFVKPDSQLDREAYKRSTSVYLVDRVLPMLPEKLSNDLCSLKPNEDKLVFSALFTFDRNWRLVNRWFGKGIIHSDHRFTYEAAQECIETGSGPFAKELRKLNAIAKKLRNENLKGGGIQFESSEVQFVLNENNEPVSIQVKERKDAHLLIEDFMLLANKEVAIFISRKGQEQEIPFIYRIHDLPDVEKIREFSLFAKELGITMQIDTPRKIAESLNSIQYAVAKDPALRALGPLAIRTMAKAAYSTDNIGHFGLGFANYTHFTSPIRRYSDVLAHRILEKNLKSLHRVNGRLLEEKCTHISLQERKAIESERESVKFKQVEFMQKYIGQTFVGYVSGIIDKGIFVELKDSKCEGLVPFNTMGESYTVSENRFRAMSNHSGHAFSFGDMVKVKIVEADLDRKEVEMELLEY